METPNVWMLLTAAGSTGVAVPLTAHLGEGTHGNALRRVDVQDGSAELQQSASAGAKLAYDLLYREKYLNRQIVVRFESDSSLLNVHGRSADLAFALAFAVAEIRARHDRDDIDNIIPRLAATGVLSDDGRILGVDGVAEKLALAIAGLPPRAVFIFPGANERDITPALRQQAKARDAVLLNISTCVVVVAFGALWFEFFRNLATLPKSLMFWHFHFENFSAMAVDHSLLDLTVGSKS